MLRRAGVSSLLAAVAALLGFTGLLQSTALIVQMAFFVFVAFAFLSLIFSLFEPAGKSVGFTSLQGVARLDPASTAEPADAFAGLVNRRQPRPRKTLRLLRYRHSSPQA